MRRNSANDIHRLCLFLIAIMLMSIVALALAGCGTSDWTSITDSRLAPSDLPRVSVVVGDPAHDVLYAATIGQGVWRCTAPSTKPAWSQMVGGANLDYVNDVLYEPTHRVLYAAANTGVYSWANPSGSASWKSINGVGGDSALAYDPSADILYAGTMAGVYRCVSPARSPSWVNTGGGVDGSSTRSLVFDRVHRVLFAATDSQGIGVWKYQEGVWTNTDKDFGASRSIGGVGSLAYDVTRDILYASSGNKILRCMNAEIAPSWNGIGTGIHPDDVSSVAYDAGRNILYVGTQSPAPVPGIMDPTASAPKLRTTSQGVWACADPDKTPTVSNTGGAVSSKEISNLYFDPARHALYAVVVADKGVWRYKPSSK